MSRFKKSNNPPQDIVMVVAMLSKFMKEQDALKAKVCSKDIKYPEN
jgi:hypothetical protein